MEVKYPEMAGFKEGETSRENAERIEASGRASSLRERVKALYLTGWHGTADEAARHLGEPFIAVRPRLSELRAAGVIEPAGPRRKADGGGTAHVWRKVIEKPDEAG